MDPYDTAAAEAAMAADADVAALEKEMEEITGQIPTSHHHHHHHQGGHNETIHVNNEEETQILGLDDENAHDGGDGTETSGLMKKVVNKFVLEGENNDGIVYYVVENDEGTVYSLQENHEGGDADSQVMELEESVEHHDQEQHQHGGVNPSDNEKDLETSESFPTTDSGTGDGESTAAEILVDSASVSATGHSYFEPEEIVTIGSGNKGVQRSRVTLISNSKHNTNNINIPHVVEVPNKIPKLEPGLIPIPEEQEQDKMPPLWEENACIICNTSMTIDDPENLGSAHTELKKFYAKMMGLGEGLQLDHESTYPICDTCTEDITQMRSVAQKIELMYKQFERMRDNLAKKTVTTFLQRKEPELQQKDEEVQQMNPNYEGQNRSALKDTIFNRWKNRYELNVPGPKSPLLIKTMDSKGRSTFVRMTPQESKDVLKYIPVARCVSKGGKEVRRVIKIDDTPETSPPDTSRLEYKCKDCHKSFGSSNMLAYHSRIHSGELPFECELCGKGFAVPHYLMIHMRSHTGEKPYKCEVCGKGFAQRGGLVTHNLVHSGDKPFECTECGKSFRQKYHLTQHLLIHSGAKPFGCDICGKFFNVKMNLREHMRRHTGDRPYKCPYCLIIGFFRKKMLRDHIVKAHPTKQLPGELENLSESKPPPGRRGSSIEFGPEGQEEGASAKRGKRRIKVKADSSSEGEEEVEVDYTPTPSPTAGHGDPGKPMRITEEGEFVDESEQMETENASTGEDHDPIAI